MGSRLTLLDPLANDFWLVKDKADIPQRVAAFQKFLEEFWDGKDPLKWTVTVYRDPRSLSQNALYWKWVDEIRKSLESRGLGSYEKELIHLRLKNDILGTHDISVGSTVIKNQVPSTKNMDKGEMNDYMTKVHIWASNYNIYLTHPEDSEYAKLKAAQES